MTTNAAPLGQTMTAMITPMTPDGTVDYDGAAPLADYLAPGMRNDGPGGTGPPAAAPTTARAGHAPQDRGGQGRQGRPGRHLAGAGQDRLRLLLRNRHAEPAVALPRRGRFHQRGRPRGRRPATRDDRRVRRGRRAPGPAASLRSRAG